MKLTAPRLGIAAALLGFLLALALTAGGAFSRRDGVPIGYIGDSTAAIYPKEQGLEAVPDLIPGIAPTMLAVPGDTINQQASHWREMDADTKRSFRAVIIRVGLNDVTDRGDARAAIARYQALVDLIRSETAPSCKVVVSQMTPARRRWPVRYSSATAPVAHRQWLELNEAIAGRGPRPIQGVDARVTGHVAALSDQYGNLAARFDTGDGVHINNAARRIVAVWETRALTPQRAENSPLTT
jgi:hypothetical protein